MWFTIVKPAVRVALVLSKWLTRMLQMQPSRSSTVRNTMAAAWSSMKHVPAKTAVMAAAVVAAVAEAAVAEEATVAEAAVVAAMAAAEIAGSRLTMSVSVRSGTIKTKDLDLVPYTPADLIALIKGAAEFRSSFGIPAADGL